MPGSPLDHLDQSTAPQILAFMLAFARLDHGSQKHGDIHTDKFSNFFFSARMGKKKFEKLVPVMYPYFFIFLIQIEISK